MEGPRNVGILRLNGNLVQRGPRRLNRKLIAQRSEERAERDGSLVPAWFGEEPLTLLLSECHSSMVATNGSMVVERAVTLKSSFPARWIISIDPILAA